jgi:hypothetical protein
MMVEIFNSISIRKKTMAIRAFLSLMPQSGQPKDYEINICCFSTKHISLNGKSKDLLAGNQDKIKGSCELLPSLGPSYP